MPFIPVFKEMINYWLERRRRIFVLGLTARPIVIMDIVDMTNINGREKEDFGSVILGSTNIYACEINASPPIIKDYNQHVSDTATTVKTTIINTA